MTPCRYRSIPNRHLLAQAQSELEAGDLRQASEKGWGAAAQMVKAAAANRGWRHRSHRDLYQATGRLAQESEDERLRSLFVTAGALHTNFYEGWMTREMVQESLSQVAELVQRMSSLASDDGAGDDA